MKCKKITKCMVAILLVCSLILVVPLSASAQVGEVKSMTIDSTSNIEPRTIDRDCTINNLSYAYQLVTSDSNWWGDRTVKVKFVSSEGPTSVLVYVTDKNGDMVGGNSKTVYLGSTATFTLPSGGGSFAVYAAMNTGMSGKVKFNVRLNK